MSTITNVISYHNFTDFVVKLSQSPIFPVTMHILTLFGYKKNKFHNSESAKILHLAKFIKIARTAAEI